MKKVVSILLMILVSHISLTVAKAQLMNVDKDIARYRMGELVVKAKSGDQVKIEQVRHEFWFGAAISNGFIDGSMSESDRKQYEEKFLKNFNSAVTENAVKWLSMERQRGSV